MALVDQIIGVESGGDPNAKNPRSSATGAGQFISETWIDMIARNRPDLAQGRSREEILALRTDPALSKEMTGAYARENEGVLTRAGHPVNPANVYLAHFAGPSGATALLNADPNASAASILGDRAVAANPFLRGMSVGALKNWAINKMGRPDGAQGPQGAQPTGAPTAPMAMAPATAGGAPAAAPAAQATPQGAPMAVAPQQQPQQAQQPMLAEAAQISTPMLDAVKARLFAAMRGSAG